MSEGTTNTNIHSKLTGNRDREHKERQKYKDKPCLCLPNQQNTTVFAYLMEDLKVKH